MIVLETERLTLRHASLDDADFVLRLLNEPSFIQFIGDRGVRTLDEAREYVTERFLRSYELNGFGLWVVERRTESGPIGISGLVKRDALPDPDIGFAFLPEFWSVGYAYESAAAVKQYALTTLRLRRLLAITSEDNDRSIRIVKKLGLRFLHMLSLSDDQDQVRLFAFEDSH